ncbi:MAG: hypothetical protein DCC68_02010 [Planctomycetota bacterium]|nr:MAG: hypothetical protein DCC68_02010 [Planctomycetota bacterium]
MESRISLSLQMERFGPAKVACPSCEIGETWLLIAYPRDSKNSLCGKAFPAMREDLTTWSVGGLAMVHLRMVELRTI